VIVAAIVVCFVATIYPSRQRRGWIPRKRSL